MSPTTAPSDRDGDRTLLTSPPRDEVADRACLERMTGGAPRERDVLVVSYDRAADAVVRDLKARLGERPRNLGVVDVHDAMRSAATPVDGNRRPGIPNVAVSVADPGALDALLEVVGQFVDDWDGGDSVVYVDSVTGMIHRIGIVAALAFVDSLGALLSSEGHLGYFRLHDAAHDALTLAALDPRFDSVARLGEDGTWSEHSAATDALAPLAREGRPLSPDRAFDLLSNPRRRLLLHGLRLAGGTASLSGLASFVADREAGPSERPTEESASRVYAGLWHVHLPKLDDLGVVSYDESADAVELVEPRRLEPYLSLTAMGDLNE